MDTEIVDAVGALDMDRDQAHRWFRDLLELSHPPDSGWSEFRGAAESAGLVSAATEEFFRVVEDRGGTDLVGRLRALDVDALLDAYDTTHAQPGGGGQAGHAEPQVDHIDAVVAAYGADWVSFDGTEQGWAGHRDRLYSWSHAYDPAAYAAVYAAVHPLEGRPMPERITALRQLGLPVPDTPTAPGDPWRTLIDGCGHHWAALDGSPQSWAASRDEFYRAANALDPELYAMAYTWVSGLESGPMESRVAALRHAGLPTGGAATSATETDGGAAMSVEDIIAALQEGLAEEGVR